jgi:AcrR family transcriptional regulator
MPEPAKERRRYAGASFADRQSERRERLILAAIDVFGRAGREGATVAAICAEAGLTARYFYESFQNRDALFLEAFRAVQRELLSRLEASIDPSDPVRSALTGFFAALAEHPGPARVFLLDPHGREPEMQAAGQEAAARLGRLFAPGVTSRLAVIGLLGAIIQIARSWIAGGFAEPVATVVATAQRFARALGTSSRS